MSRAELSDSGEIKNIHYGDVLIKYGDTLDLSNDDIPYISLYSSVKRNDVFLTDGDVIIADTAEDETVGKATELYNVGEHRAVSGLHTIPCRPRKSFVSKYLGFYLNSPHYRKQLITLMQGVKVLSVSKANIATTFVSYPSESEQTKIVSTLSLLDKRIAKQRELVESLKSYKRGVLSRLFPQNGESVPRLRFAGFDNVWKSVKIGDIATVSMCKRIFKEQTTPNGEIPFYKIGTFGGAADSYISRQLFEEYKNKYPYPHKGDVLISASGSIGRTVVYNGDDEYFQDSNIVWLNHDESITNDFLKHLYDIIEWSGIEGSTIKRLYNDNILNTIIKIPEILEQDIISKTLDVIDSEISNTEIVLMSLYKLKNGMLNNLFI